MKVKRPEFFKDRHGEWRWRVRAKNGRIVAHGGEGYSRLANARKGCHAAALALSIWTGGGDPMSGEPEG